MNEKLKGREQVAALAVQRLEMQNLRCAWQYLGEQHDLETFRRLLPASSLFQVMNDLRVETRECVQLLADILSYLKSGEVEQQETGREWTSLRALALAAYRFFSWEPATSRNGIPYQLESLKIAQTIPDSQEKAYALMLDCIYTGGLEREEVISLYNQSAQIYEHLGDDWGQALCLNGLSFVEQKKQNLEEAYRLGCQSLEIFLRMGNHERLLDIRHNLGEMAEHLGKFEQARQHFEANRRYFVQNKDERWIKYYYARMASLGKR